MAWQEQIKGRQLTFSFGGGFSTGSLGAPCSPKSVGQIDKEKRQSMEEGAEQGVARRDPNRPDQTRPES